MTNTGHGHVTPRSDGVKARCGGPAICHTCALEAAQKTAAETSSEPSQDQVQEMVNVWRAWTAQTPGLRPSVDDLMRRAYRVAREMETR